MALPDRSHRSRRGVSRSRLTGSSPESREKMAYIVVR
jgi:hypothetical protein